MFSFPGSRFPGVRDSQPFSFPDSWELKRRHSRRKAGTSHRQLVIKWDARQWLQRVQTTIVGQLTAAGSRSTKQLCCVHYRVAGCSCSLAGQQLSFLPRVQAQSCSWHCVHCHWWHKCQRCQTRMLSRTSLSASVVHTTNVRGLAWRPNARSLLPGCFAPNCILVWTTAP